jgi:Putative Ig domain
VTAAGAPDDATGNGSTIVLNLPDDAKSISFIGTGTEGNQSTTATATFSDGSTASVPIQFSDWTLGGNANGTPAYGNIVVAKSAYRLAGASKDSAQPFLFATAPYQIPDGKKLVSVTLPKQTGDPSSVGRIHVFAIADDGTPVAPLAATAPKDQTATAGKALSADLGSVTGGVAGASGYQARVQWGDGTVPEDVTVGSSGALNGQHAYQQPGTYTVHVTAWDTQSSTSATFTVTVAQEAAVPAVTASVTTGDSGTSLVLKGSGFTAGERVAVRLATDPSVVVTVTATSAGEIHTTVALPRGTRPGRYAVVAVGSSSRTPATATVQVGGRPSVQEPGTAVIPTSTPAPGGAQA